MSLEDQEKTEKIAVFIRHLVDAGMPIEKAVERGFDYAMEASKYRHGRMLPTKEEYMDLAAKRLEDAAKQAGVHLNQQQATKEQAAQRLSHLYDTGGKF